jgi:formylmethanofuran dehydrogenase subunit E
MSEFDDPDAPKPEDLVECPSCHKPFPKDQLRRAGGGRILCVGCISAWFEDEDEEGEEKER